MPHPYFDYTKFYLAYEKKKGMIVMAKKDKGPFYISTPIYYPSDNLHIGQFWFIFFNLPLKFTPSKPSSKP